jgi:multiple sugar transport system substrate-binding protein
MLVKNYTYDDLATRGVLADVTGLAQELDREDPFMPMARTIFERSGRYFALPVNVHGLVTYVNLDALAAVGVTTVPDEGFSWDEIWQLAPKLARRAGNPAAPADYALFEPPAYPVLTELGGALFDNPYRPTRVTIDSPAGRAWVEWCQRLEASGWCAPRSTALDQGTYQLFRDGRVVFFFSGRWQVPDFAGQTAFRWDIRPFPAGPHGRVTMHGGTGISVSADTHQPEAAKKFARFYAGRPGAEISMRAGRTVPVQRGLAHSAAFLGLHPPASSRHFVDTMEAGASGFWLYAPGAPEISRIVTRRMDEALSDLTLPPAIVTKRLQEDLERWLVHQQRNKRMAMP